MHQISPDCTWPVRVKHSRWPFWGSRSSINWVLPRMLNFPVNMSCRLGVPRFIESHLMHGESRGSKSNKDLNNQQKIRSHEKHSIQPIAFDFLIDPTRPYGSRVPMPHLRQGLHNESAGPFLGSAQRPKGRLGCQNWQPEMEPYMKHIGYIYICIYII